MIIYKVTNKINNKEYIGQTVYGLELRKRKHIWSSLNRCIGYFHNAIRKHGPDNFVWQIIHDNVNTIEELNRLEIYYIGYYDTYNNGYNLTLGGDGSVGFKHSKETIKKLKGRKFSDEHKKNISESGKNRKPATIETRKKLSLINSGKNNSFYGKQHTVKTKESISKANKGKRTGKDSPGARSVVIAGKYFDTLKDAGKFIGKTPSNTRYRILHKTRWLDYSYTK